MAEPVKLIRTLRLDDKEIEEIIERLDKGEEAFDDSVRAARRFQYHAKGCVVHLHAQAGSAPASYLVPTRNLSNGGMSFLHGSFLYTGAKCIVQLTTVHGTWEHVPAEIVRCAYVSQGVHDIGVRFLRQIDASEYCAGAIRRRALLVDDNKAILKFAELMLKRLNVECDMAERGEAAIALAFSQVYDFILMDMEMPGMSGFDTVKELRRQGYSGTIVAATGLTRDEDRERCMAAGCSAYLPKPLQKEQVTSLLRSFCQEPLRSSFAHDPAMVPMIDDFVAQLGASIRDIEAALANEDSEALARLCRDMKSEAGTFGFEPISSAASDAEQALASGKPIRDAEPHIKILVGLCRQARGCSVRARADGDAPPHDDERVLAGEGAER